MKEFFIADSKDEYFLYQMYLVLRCLQLLYLEVKFQVIPTVFNYEEKKIGALKHTNLRPCATYGSIKMRIEIWLVDILKTKRNGKDRNV